MWTKTTGTALTDYGQGVFATTDGFIYVTGYTSASLNSQTWAGIKHFKRNSF